MAFLSLVGGVMEMLKLLAEVYEQEFFTVIGIASWFDFVAYLASYVFVIIVSLIMFVAPLVYAALVFIP